jgi:hypothetical protein
MTAAGKITAAGIAERVAAGETVHIFITDHPIGKHASAQALAGGEPERPWGPTTVKTKVVCATVTGSYTTAGGRRSRRVLVTSRGEVPNLSASQTFHLAYLPPDPVPSGDDAAVDDDPTPEADAATLRQHTVFLFCAKHAGFFAGERRQRVAEFFAEGGPATSRCHPDGACRVRPGRDLFVPNL